MDFNKYKNEKEYPKPISFKCSKCNEIYHKNNNYCSACGNNVHLEYKKNKQEYDRKYKEYNEEENMLFDLFKYDALKDAGLQDHPKKDRIFYYAWEKGHSAGYYEVYGVLMDLSGLFLED